LKSFQILFIIELLFLCGLFPLVETSGSIQETPTILAMVTDFDEPIDIYENNDFIEQGWQGSGTTEDPFIIENLKIIEAETTCISIRNTNVSFIIRNCSLLSERGEHGSYGQAGSSIRLIDVENGTIEDCIIRKSGILLVYSVGCMISYNTVSDCMEDYGSIYEVRKSAINIVNSIQCIVSNNTIRGSMNGIHIDSPTDNEMRRTHHQIINNRIYGNERIGIIIEHPVRYVHIENNVVYGNDYIGIAIGGSSVTDGLLADTNVVVENKIGWNDQNARDACTYNIWGNNSFSDNSESDIYQIPGGWPTGGPGRMWDYTPKLWTYDGTPTIDHPEDIAFAWSTRNTTANWKPSDNLPLDYSLFLDEELIESKTWDEAEIEWNFGVLYPGIYNATIVVYNAVGSFVSDTVTIEVSPQNHGLYWGVKENTSLLFSFYTEKHTDEDVIVNAELAMNVTYLPDILDYIEYIPAANYISYWLNNKSLPPLEYFFEGGGSIHAIIAPALATGNWSLYTNLLEEAYPPEVQATLNMALTIVNDTERWGMRFEYSSGNSIIQSETTWFKNDGTLESIHLSIANPDVGTVVVRVNREEADIFNPLQIAVIGIVGTGVIATGIFVVRRRNLAKGIPID